MLILTAAAWPLPLQAAHRPSACRVLTNSEVAKALGKKVATRTARSYTGVLSACEWTSVPLSNFTPATAQASVRITQVGEPTFNQLALENGSIRVRGFTHTAWATTGNGSELDVWQNGFALAVTVTMVTSPLPAEKILAKKALGRL